MTDLRSTTIDVASLAQNYLGKKDWEVNEDANISFSFPGYMEYVSERVTKRYALAKLVPPKAAKAHNDGDIYIHDLGKHLVPYCSGWDLRKLLLEGFTGVPDKCSAGPAKHLATALDHASRFILIICNEWSGAQAFSSLDTFMAPFIREDKLSQKDVKSAVQSFLYNLGINTRYGGQIPFSNISLDLTVPEDLRDDPVIIGGKTQDTTYKDYQKEMDMFNQAVIEAYMEGDYASQPFSFPIPTYNLTKDFDWDGNIADLLFDMTAKYGNPYFQNFINSNLKPGDVRAMCCRLQMDMSTLITKTGGRWATGASTGSFGVVDVNLGRIGYLVKDEKDPEKAFLSKLDELLDLCKDTLESKISLVNKNLELGLMPYTKRYLESLDTYFSTIGIIGMNEALRNMWEITTADKKGVEFSIRVLQHIRDRLIKYQEETGHLYNLEATPNESGSPTLARKDKEKYPDIITAGNGKPYYTNSTQLPVGHTDDIFEALDLQEELQTLYTGGTVFHVFLGERLASAKECKALVKKIATTYKLPYFSITPTFSICPTHGYLKGERRECPEKDSAGERCKETPLVYSRIVGYYRPVRQWNDGKKQEYVERKTFCDECPPTKKQKPGM